MVEVMEQKPAEQVESTKKTIMEDLRQGKFKAAFDASKTNWEQAKASDDLVQISQAARVYAAVLKRKQNLKDMADFLADELNPIIEQKLVNDPSAYARGLFAKKTVSKSLMTFDKEDIPDKYEKIYQDNTQNATVLKYYIKTLYNLTHFDDINNDHIVVLQRIDKALSLFPQYESLVDKTAKRLSLKKLKQKIMIVRCKFDLHFVNHDDMKNKLKDLLNEVGIKSRLSIKVMQLYINLYLQNYDIQTASNYAQRNFVKTEDLLGANHPEQIANQSNLIGVMVKAKKYKESLDEILKLEKMIKDSEGDWQFITQVHSNSYQYECMAGLNQEIELEEMIKVNKNEWLKQACEKAKGSVYFNCQLGLMQHFMKFQRFDKILKFIKEGREHLKSLGVTDSYQELFLDFFEINADQNGENFEKMATEMEKVIAKCEELNKKKSGMPHSQLLFTFKATQCQFLLALQDIEKCKTNLAQLLEDHKVYYKDNDSVETLATVYSLLGSLDLAEGQFKPAIEKLQKAEKIIKQSNGEEDEQLLEMYAMLGSCFVQLGDQEGIRKFNDYQIKRMTLASSIHGKKHEAYASVLEERAQFCLQMNWVEEALRCATELKTIQVEMLNGEANIQVIETYKILMTVNFRLSMFNDALKAAQARVSLYKQFSNNQIDATYVSSLIDLSMCQSMLQKFDDSLASLKEAENITKDKKNNIGGELETYIKQSKEDILKRKAEFDALHVKPIWQRIMPNTPAKIAVFATVVAAVSGVTAYAVLKNRNNS